MRRLIIFISITLVACDPRHLVPFEKTNELTVLIKEPSTSGAGSIGTEGFDRDLAQMLAKELGKKIRFVPEHNDRELLETLRDGDATLAAAWQSPIENAAIKHSRPYFKDHDILVTPEASLPPRTLGQLAQREVHVIAGSLQEQLLKQIAGTHPKMRIIPEADVGEMDLMADISHGKFDTALISDTTFGVGSNFYPELQKSLEIGPSRPIVWLFPPGTDDKLIERCNAFLEQIEQNGALDRLRDRYFGHIDRINPANASLFIERMHNVLPRYGDFFKNAQLRTGIDWRVLAALAYQESRWDPLATSPTGVRGMMMLTEETADEMGVSNRLEAAQSIVAGAQYLNELREALPPQIREPDRLWMALAAYNLGMGHLRAARYIAGTLNIDPDSWYNMKKVLPLLAQPKYYNRLKSGKGRGGEAVIMVENIRVFTDILKRHESSFRAIDMIPGIAPPTSARLPEANY